MNAFRTLLIVATGAVFAFVSIYFVREKLESNQAAVEAPPIDTLVGQTIQENRGLPPFFAGEASGAAGEEYTPQVTSPNAEAGETIPCTGAEHANFDCYEDFFKAFTEERGIKASFGVLRATYPSDDYVRSQCHPLTHVIGRAAATRFETVGEAFAEADSFCWSGYHHGVMEAVIGKIGRKNVSAEMDGICKSLREARHYSFDHYNCVHGLGHGVMALTQTELFDSLTLCDNLTDQWERASCWSGAFMENVIVDGKNHITKYLKPEEPLYPCNAVGEAYKQTCYLMQTSYMLKVVSGDFRKVFDLCEEADRGHVETCYQSLGRDASGRSVSDVAQTKATCMLGKNYTQQSNCVIGAVKDFISYHHGIEEARALCASFDRELQSVCTETAEGYYRLL